MKIKVPINRLILINLSLLLFACSTVQETTVQEKQQQINAEKALEYFIKGVTEDNSGYHSKAIESFTTSLMYDSLTTRAATTYYSISKAYRSVRQPQLALQYGLKSIKLDASNQEYQSNLADLYFENNLFKESADIYEKLVESDPDNSEYLFKLAIMYHLSKRLTKALETFELYIVRFGEDYNVRMQQLLIYDALNERQKIITILSEMVANDPGNDNIRRTLSREYMQKSEFDSAAVVLSPILDTKPDDIETLLILADIYYRAGNDEKMNNMIDRLLNRPDMNDDDLMNIGQTFIQMGEMDSSSIDFGIRLFSVMEERSPEDWRPKWFLGINYLTKNDLDAAVLRFLTVTEKRPDMVQAWQNLGIAYLQDNKYKDASFYLSKALLIHPMDFQLNYFKGFAEVQLENDSIAIEVLKKASEINPYTIEPLILLASSFERLQNFQTSDSLFERILSIDPENDLVMNNFAYSLSERGLRLEYALELSAKSLESEPENAAYLDTYGWILYKLGRYREARDFIQKSVDTGDASPVVLEHLGDVYFKLNDVDNARLWWNKSLDKKPNQPNLLKKVKELDLN